MLSQGVRYGDPENGADRELLREFSGRRIKELEGTEVQLRLFDGLPEEEQRDLLAALLGDFARSKGDPARLTRIWLREIWRSLRPKIAADCSPTRNCARHF